MAEQPAGQVTLLFTDIEGSTALLSELGGERYADALDEHRRIVRAACAGHMGYEVDNEGDAFFFAFQQAADAAAAAREAQAGLAGGPMLVRMGLHSGEPLARPPKYVGLDVHMAARVMASAHGGQIVLSNATRRLLEDQWPLRELGWHRLKDVGEPQLLHQLGDGQFPPLRTLSHTNLPVPPTRFLGRTRERAEVVSLLGGPDVRLLTLTGAGGSGKTRLALAAAEELAHGYPYGVTFVGLAAVRDVSLVPATIGRALGAHGDPAAQIGAKRLLLTVDNFEHVVEAAPSLAALVAECPNLDVLVTSREPLRIGVEREYYVPPLAAPEALRLYSARARAFAFEFEPDEVAEQICARLDHLPLALELAAAQLRTLAPAEILARLDRRLPILTRGARDAPERHQTLRATIGWSHDLLGPGERRLFARLAVFAGGCTLAAAQEVCEAELARLHALNDKSLIRHQNGRYRMLETIREYAAEQLERSGEADMLRTRHADFFTVLAEAARPELERAGGTSGTDQASVLGQLIPEHANFRSALGWLLDGRNSVQALRLVTALTRFWDIRAAPEGLAWFERALAAGDAPVKLRIDALAGASQEAYYTGQLERATAHAEEALALSRSAGYRAGIAASLLRLTGPLIATGRLDEAKGLLQDAAELNRELGRLHEYTVTLQLLGGVFAQLDDLASAQRLFEEALAVATDLGDSWTRALILTELGRAPLKLGDYHGAAAHAHEGLTLCRQIDDPVLAIELVANLAAAWLRLGQPRQAGRLWSVVERIESDLDERRWYWDKTKVEIEELMGPRSSEFRAGVEEGYWVPTAEIIDRAAQGELADAATIAPTRAP